MMQTYIFLDDGGNVVGEYSTNDVGNARAECARRASFEKKNLAVYRWVGKYIYVAPDTENKDQNYSCAAAEPNRFLDWYL